MKIFDIKSNVFKSLFLVALLCCFANSAWAGWSSDRYYAKINVHIVPSGAGTVYAEKTEGGAGVAETEDRSLAYRGASGYSIDFDLGCSEVNDTYTLLYWCDSTKMNADKTAAVSTSDQLRDASGVIKVTVTAANSNRVNNAKQYGYYAVFAKLAVTSIIDPFENCQGTQTRIISVAHQNAGTITASLTGDTEGFSISQNKSFNSTSTAEITDIVVSYTPQSFGHKDVTLTLISNAYDINNQQSISTSVDFTADDCKPTFEWTTTTAIKQRNSLPTVVKVDNNVQTIQLDAIPSGIVSITQQSGSTWPSIEALENEDTETKTVTLIANVAAEGGYAAATDTFVIYVSNKSAQTIDWPSAYKLPLFREGDVESVLDAVAKAVDGTSTGATITYTLETGQNIVSRDGTSLTALREGTTTITASAEETTDYLPVSVTKTIIVSKNTACESYAIDVPASKTVKFTSSGATNAEYIATVPGNTLTFEVSNIGKTNKNGTNYTNGYISVYGYTSATSTQGTDISSLATTSLKNGDGKYTLINVDTLYRKFVFVMNQGYEQYPSGNVFNVKLTQANFIKPQTNVLNVEQAVYTYTNISFKVKYSDQPSLVVSNINPNVEILYPSAENGYTIATGCGTAGEVTIQLRVKEYSSATTVTEQDVITISDGMATDPLSASVTLNIDVINGETYYFVGTEDSQWENLDNWSLTETTPYTKPLRLPTNSNSVYINSPAVINSAREVYKLDIQTGGAVTIAPAGGLSVYNGGLTGATSTNLKLASDATGMGYLRVHPSATNKTVSASVDLFVHGYTDYHSIADAETEADKLKAINAAIWQYLGTPMATTPQSIDYYGWMYERSDNAWEVCNTSTNLTPFAGYAMTQSLSEDGAAFTCSGELYGFKDWTGTPAAGFQLLANSFTAPIDITKFESIPGDVIYLYREGSFDNYNDGGSEAVEPDPNNLSGITSFAGFISAGQYLAIPLGTAKLLPKGFATIPPSQGFCILADGNQLTLDYDKLVWGGEGFGLHTRAMAPARKRAAQANEEIVLSEVLGLRVVGERGSDALGLIESTAFTASFDSGFDGSKVFGSSANPQLYTTEPSGNMMVSATNDLEGMYIGFDAAETDKETLSNYTIEVLYAQEGEYILHDNVANKDMELKLGNTYEFSVAPGMMNETRFQIKVAKGTGSTTSLEDYTNSDDIRIWEHNGKLFADAKTMAEQTLRIYDMQGKMLVNTKFTNTLTYDLSTLPSGAYMANVGNKSIKIVLK